MSDTVTSLNAVLIDPEDQTETVLGTVDIDAQGYLTATSPAPGYESLLDEVIESINSKDVIRVRVPGTEKFEITTERYHRDDEGIVEAVRKYLMHYSGIDLRSTAAADQFEDFQDLT